MTEFLKEYKYVKEFGGGIDRMFNEMAEFRLPESEYSIYAFMTKAAVKNNIDLAIILNDILNELERKIMAEILRDKKVTADTIALNIGYAINTVKRYFIAMQKKDLLVRIGAEKTGHWEVKR